jgi:plasmid maintenance system antidote protein VapI
MIGVDLIGQIRRAYFEQQRSIKEIVRTLLVSRATVRKVIRGISVKEAADQLDRAFGTVQNGTSTTESESRRR